MLEVFLFVCILIWELIYSATLTRCLCVMRTKFHRIIFKFLIYLICAFGFWAQRPMKVWREKEKRSWSTAGPNLNGQNVQMDLPLGLGWQLEKQGSNKMLLVGRETQIKSSGARFWFQKCWKHFGNCLLLAQINFLGFWANLRQLEAPEALKSLEKLSILILRKFRENNFEFPCFKAFLRLILGFTSPKIPCWLQLCLFRVS